MRDEFHKRCEAIEESYEFMLAYAAQGLAGEGASQSGGQLREYLTRASAALSGLGGRAKGLEPAVQERHEIIPYYRN